jgi:hypothetical protein
MRLSDGVKATAGMPREVSVAHARPPGVGGTRARRVNLEPEDAGERT